MINLGLSLGKTGGGGVPEVTLSVGPRAANGTVAVTISAHADWVTSVQGGAFDGAMSVFAEVVQTPDISGDGEIVATFEAGTVTDFLLTVTAPAHYAGEYPFDAADFADGPYQLKAAEVSEAAGVYTAIPGLWVHATDDPALFTYEWRTGATVWTAGDGVAADGLSFEPDTDAQDAIDLDGLDFAEVAQNSAGTTTETVAAYVPQVFSAVRFASATPGILRMTTSPANTRKWTAIMRVKLNSLASDQYVFGRGLFTGIRVRTTGAGEIHARKEGGTAYTGSEFTTGAGTFVTGQWYSFFMSADLDFGLPGSRALQLVRNGTVLGPAPTGSSTTGNFWAGFTIPYTLGGLQGLTQVANADYDLFAAFFVGQALDGSNSTIWEEVFDPTNGHAFRADYLNGTKVTVGGVTPTTVFRGTGLITATNAIGGGHAWTVDGTAPTQVFE